MLLGVLADCTDSEGAATGALTNHLGGWKLKSEVIGGVGC